MKELQMLVNKWKYEADDIKNKSGAAVNFAAMPIAAEWRRLRKCITEAQLLLDEVTKRDTPPQLHKRDVIRWVEFEKQMPPITTWVCFRYKDEEVDTGHFRNEEEIQRWIAKYKPIAWCLLPPFV